MSLKPAAKTGGFRKSNRIFCMNIGSASMLLIFVILCLVSFAALSIVSANADKRLTDKIASRTRAYYDACNSAEASLAAIDQVLAKQYRQCADENAYYSAVGHSKSYAISVDDNQTLLVEIRILYPETADDCFYEVTSWQIITD